MTLGPRSSSAGIVSFDPAFAVGHTENTTSFIASDPALPRFELSVMANVRQPSQRLGSSVPDHKIASELLRNCFGIGRRFANCYPVHVDAGQVASMPSLDSVETGCRYEMGRIKKYVPLPSAPSLHFLFGVGSRAIPYRD